MHTCRLQILEQKKKIKPLKVNFSLRKAELVKEKVSVHLFTSRIPYELLVHELRAD